MNYLWNNLPLLLRQQHFADESTPPLPCSVRVSQMSSALIWFLYPSADFTDWLSVIGGFYFYHSRSVVFSGPSVCQHDNYWTVRNFWTSSYGLHGGQVRKRLGVRGQRFYVYSVVFRFVNFLFWPPASVFERTLNVSYGNKNCDRNRPTFVPQLYTKGDEYRCVCVSVVFDFTIF